MKKKLHFRRLSSLVLALALALCLLPAYQAAAYRNDETIDLTSIEATQITALDVSYEALIDEEGGVVYFSYTAQEAGTFYIYTSASEDCDTYLRVYDEDGDLLSNNDDAFEDSNDACVVLDLEEGQTCYIAAELYNDGDTGSFDVIVSMTKPDGYNDDDDDDYGAPETIDPDSADASELNQDETADVEITEEGGIIYFSFTAAADGTYAIYTTGDGDAYLAVYDADGNYLTEDDDSGAGTDSYVTVTLSDGETVYIAAYCYGYGTGSYVITVSEADPSYLGNGIYYSYADGTLTLYAEDYTYFSYYADEEDEEDVLAVLSEEVTQVIIGDYIYDLDSGSLEELFVNLETVTLSGDHHIVTDSGSYEWEEDDVSYYDTYSNTYGLIFEDDVLYYYYEYEEDYNGESYSGSGQYIIWANSVICTSLAGANRYETVEEIVSETYGDYTCEYAVIATGTNYPDALSAASLAGVLYAPIILTRDSKISDTLSLLEELEVEEAYIIGGTSAVSTAIEEAIEAAGIETTRLAGANRQETSILIAEEVQSIRGTYWDSDTCIVAYGNDYADALSASPYAYWSESPIYLTSKDGSVSDAVIESITEAGYDNIIVVGGESVITADAVSALEATGAEVTRLAGANRYETSAKVAAWSVEQGMSYDGAAVATGKDYADALSGSALCGYNGSVLLLASDGKYAGVDQLTESSEHINQIYFLGGTSALSDTVRNYVKNLLD